MMVDRLGFRVYDSRVHHLPAWSSVLKDWKRNTVCASMMQQSIRSFSRVVVSETLHCASLSNKHLVCRFAKKCRYSSKVWKVHHRASVSQRAVVERSSLFSVRGSDEMSSEESVGILCHANSCPGFRGILKQRYSDFLVNEVDLSGKVIHLTSIDAPQEITDKKNQAPKETVLEGKADEEKSKSDECVADVEAFRGLAGETNANVLQELLDQIANSKGGTVPPALLAPDNDKMHRAAIHNFFKTRLTFFVTDTVDGPTSNEKCVRLRHTISRSGGGGGRGGRFQKRGRDFGSWGQDNKRQKPIDGETDQPFDSRGSNGWPADRPKFLQFHLYKENKDTQDALMVISRMLHVQPKSFGFAGTKDKRAITTQQVVFSGTALSPIRCFRLKVTVFKQTATQLAALNKRLYGIRVGDFSYVDKALVLGQLSGNRFTVTLRGVVAEKDETIRFAAEGLGGSGFINYFGLQRFGSGSVPTHLVGAALLRGDWKGAANLILHPRVGDQPEVKEAREYYRKTQDADGALQQFPRYLTAERALLTSLKRDSKNYLQAISTIPRTLRLMYVHSYQSFLWNHAASHRAKTYGIQEVVAGDLVYNADDRNNSARAVPKIGESDTLPTNTGVGIPDGVLDELIDVDVAAEGPCGVKCVTAEDITSRKYQTWDVLLPLPGGSTLYPENDTADIYQKLAGKDSVDLQTCTHNVKEFSITQSPGGYRRLLQKPVDLEWKILKYADATKQLAETDLDRLQIAGGNDHSADKDGVLKSALTVVSEEDGINPIPPEEVIKPEGMASFPVLPEESANNAEGNSETEGTAVQLTFTLPASCYATMAIRELLKISTSVAFHKTLNDESAN